MIIGQDFDKITQVSLDALKQLSNKKLKRVVIILDETGYETAFIFEDKDVYTASGFSIGYNGEGPRGLYSAIKMFCPDAIGEDFFKTKISTLKGGKWVWSPEYDFVEIV